MTPEGYLWAVVQPREFQFGSAQDRSGLADRNKDRKPVLRGFLYRNLDTGVSVELTARSLVAQTVPVFRNKGRSSTLQGSSVHIQGKGVLPEAGSSLVVLQRIPALLAFHNTDKKHEWWRFPYHIQGKRG